MLEKMAAYEGNAGMVHTLQNQKLHHLSNQTSNADSKFGSAAGSYPKMLPTPESAYNTVNQTSQMHHRRQPQYANPSFATPKVTSHQRNGTAGAVPNSKYY